MHNNSDGQEIILTSVILKERVKGREQGRDRRRTKRGKEREWRGEIITIAISLPVAWKGTDIF